MRNLPILLATLLIPAMSFGATLTQTLTLRGGWNTVSLYVAPAQNDVETLFADLINSGRLKGIYTYNGNTSVWQQYVVGEPILPGTLQTIEPLRGYWVELTPGVDVTLEIIGGLPPQTSLMLEPGWHFMGFGNMEPVFWEDVFHKIPDTLTSLLLYQAGWDTFSDLQSNWNGTDVNGNGAIDNVEWNLALDVGLQYQGKIMDGGAYWMRVTGGALTVDPKLEVEVEGDTDVFDPEGGTDDWFDPETDTDINGNGLLDYGLTKPGAFDFYGDPIKNRQDTISFRVPTGAQHQSLPIVTQDIRIRNTGDAGVLLYRIETDVPWLSSSLEERGQITPNKWYVLPGGSGQTVLLNANLIGLDVGEYTGTLTVHSNGGNKSYDLKLIVPPMDGSYEGTISIDTVSGKPAVVQERLIRLTLDLQGNSTLYAEGSTSVAADVPLANNGDENMFTLTGTEQIAAEDPLNPYGVAYSRTLTFSGGRFDSEVEEELRDTVGKQLPVTGTYTEEISGLSDTPILLEGTFVLTPESDWSAFEEPE